MKRHLLLKSGRGIDDEWYSLSYCGFSENSEFEWEGTHHADVATCKNCLKRFVLRNQSRYWSAEYVREKKQQYLRLR